MTAQHSTILVLLFTIAVCSGHIGGGEGLLQDINPRVYCGRSLARALAFICYDQLKDENSNENKRSDGTMYNAILSPYYKEQERQQLDLPWMSPYEARRLSLPYRKKRFVVDECCNKACKMSELASYC